jgi:hypothetical protein
LIAGRALRSLRIAESSDYASPVVGCYFLARDESGYSLWPLRAPRSNEPTGDFSANWCQDCRNLHRNLKSDVVTAYTSDLFHFVNVDVGKFNQNRDIADELGVSLTRGIPVAIFFDVNGQVIGTTNEGQLEPARHYSSRQILKFVRDVAERSRILAPDAVR